MKLLLALLPIPMILAQALPTAPACRLLSWPDGGEPVFVWEGAPAGAYTYFVDYILTDFTAHATTDEASDTYMIDAGNVIMPDYPGINASHAYQISGLNCIAIFNGWQVTSSNPGRWFNGFSWRNFLAILSK